MVSDPEPESHPLIYIHVFRRPSGAIKLDQHQCRGTDEILGAARRVGRSGGANDLGAVHNGQTDITFDETLLLPHFIIVIWYHYAKFTYVIMEHATCLTIVFFDKKITCTILFNGGGFLCQTGLVCCHAWTNSSLAISFETVLAPSMQRSIVRTSHSKPYIIKIFSCRMTAEPNRYRAGSPKRLKSALCNIVWEDEQTNKSMST